jgi:hypothetical protein
MKKNIICCFVIIILIYGCSRNLKKLENQFDDCSYKNVYLNRIKTLNCDGSHLNVELKKGTGMFENLIIVLKGTCIKIVKVIETDEWVPIETIGAFFVDKNLDLYEEGDWDGKCMGARHTIFGALTFYDYEFKSNPDNPLIFMMTDKGYQYIQGKGEVKDMISGKRFVLNFVLKH